jgi:hypothetical protein
MDLDFRRPPDTAKVSSSAAQVKDPLCVPELTNVTPGQWSSHSARFVIGELGDASRLKRVIQTALLPRVIAKQALTIPSAVSVMA